MMDDCQKVTDRDTVLCVVKALQKSRINGFEQQISDYESSSRSLFDTFDCCKRAIRESNGTESQRILKKIKLEPVAETCENSENVDPNIITINDENKLLQGMSKEFKKESDRAQSILIDLKSVGSMLVVDLRDELCRRDLNTKGVKKILQTRLKKALEADQLKEEQRANSIEDVDMISEKCTEVEQVAKDKVRDSSPLAKDLENSKAFAPLSDSTSTHNEEVIPITGVEISSNNIHTDDEIMEEQSAVPISDVSPDELCVKDFANEEKSSDYTDNELSSDPIGDNSPRKEESTVEENVGIVSKVVKNFEMEEFKDPVPSVNNMPSAPKSMGHKLLKATTKLFSPKKNCKEPGIKSPGINTEEDSGLSHAQSDGSQHDKISIPLKPNPIRQCKRGSISCNMSITDIQAHETRGKAQTALLISEEKGTSGAPTHDKTCSESKKARAVQLPENKISSKPISKITTKSIVSSKIGTEQTIAKLKALQSARKARLAEMREKASKGSKVVTLANNSGKKATIQKKMNGAMAKNETTMTKSENRKKAVAAEMRQKAAAIARQKVDSLKLTNVGQSQINLNEGSSHSLKLTNGGQCQINPNQGSSHSHLQQNAYSTFKQNQEAMSPMDTYEMSDRGESDSDTEEESDFEEQSSKKKIPKWAQKVNLIPALEKQFLGGQQHKVDPDEIFPEVSTCDLEAIFDKKKKRYLKRSSTGNWTKDSVTVSEKLVYKRKMGFKK